MSEEDANSLEMLDEARVRELEPTFLAALAAKDAGRTDDALDKLEEILKVEPRLPEPHLELARLQLDLDRLSDAEIHAREALRWLEAGGQWTEEIPEETMLALAHATLAEILRRRADEDDLVFGDPAVFRALLDESKEHFETAARLDPSDETSSYYAFFLGQAGTKPIVH
jgi:tetratricopeptide (TPR) repeat protein